MSFPAIDPAVTSIDKPVATRLATEERSLRLLMIAFNFPPAATAGVHRTLRFVKYLPEFGCQPTVLTRNCDPDSCGEQLLSQVPHSVMIHRTGVSPEPPVVPSAGLPHGAMENVSAITGANRPNLRKEVVRTVKGVLRPAWDLLTETPDQYIGWSRQAARRAIELCRGGGFDAIYTTGPPHSTHLAGLKIKRRTGLPWIADFRDPWARRPWAKARNPWGQRLLPYLERKVAREATCVVLNNDASADDFRRAYPELPAEKFISIPNGYDPDLVPIVDRLLQQSCLPSQEGHQKNGIPIICHPGTLYGQRDPRPILEAISQLHCDGVDIRFQQIGTVGPRFDLAKMSKQLGIPRLVEHIPPVSHEHVMGYMAKADVLLIIQPNGPLMVPGKLYEMLLFDKPLLAVCDSIATSQIVHAAGNAWSAESHNVSSIADALRAAVVATSELALEPRKLARRRYNGRDLAETLKRVVDSIVNSPGQQ